MLGGIDGGEGREGRRWGRRDVMDLRSGGGVWRVFRVVTVAISATREIIRVCWRRRLCWVILLRVGVWCSLGWCCYACSSLKSSTSLPGGNQVDGLPPAASVVQLAESGSKFNFMIFAKKF